MYQVGNRKEKEKDMGYQSITHNQYMHSKDTLRSSRAFIAVLHLNVIMNTEKKTLISLKV